MLQIFFAFVAGILTVGAPCILPVLPIVLGASVGKSNRTRPFFIVLGFVVSFTAAAFLFSVIAHTIGISAVALRHAGIFLLAFFGLFLLVPTFFEKIMSGMGPMIGRISGSVRGSAGNGGAFIIGLTLGIVWAPCAGPVLGAILALVATSTTLGVAAVELLAFALGAGVPMLVIAYGGQFVTTRVRAIAQYAGLVQKFFGVLVILLAIAMYLNYDVVVETKLADFFSRAESSVPASSVGLSNLGVAPDFGAGHWINSQPLTIQQLRGKVVLVDFWTYSCINCIRTLPHITSWYEKYKDSGLVVIGVHTPEFAFEKDATNVARAATQFGVYYPVLQDNDYATWGRFNNQYWPAEYLIDQNGNIVHTHFGEGEYVQTENAIRSLLGMTAMPTRTDAAETLGDIQSPEMYFGTARLQNLSSGQSQSSVDAIYKFPSTLDLNTFALSGSWKFDADKITATSADAKIRLKFHAAKLHFVAASGTGPITLHVIVDGVSQPDVVVQTAQLYTLFDSKSYTDHVVEITGASGLQAFTFTFG